MKIDLEKFSPLIDEKLISTQKHPDYDLYIFNYTQKAQFAHNWTPELLMSRGLIVDKEGNVIARPYDKFFNLEELAEGELPNAPFQAFDKMDGSLGILYKTPDGKYQIATRGSFVSEQAIKANKMLAQMVPNPIHFMDGYTYLFEIIYPENRIVVQYGEEELVLLGAREKETGKILTPDQFPELEPFFPKAQKIKDYKTPRDNAEGVVLYYENGFMCKVKYEEYVRLHRLVTGVNAKTIWEILKEHGNIQEMLERVPDEFFQWVKFTQEELSWKYEHIRLQCEHVVAYAKKFPTRKEQAAFIMTQPNPGVSFVLLDGKDPEEHIWKLIRPEATKPFVQDEP